MSRFSANQTELSLAGGSRKITSLFLLLQVTEALMKTALTISLIAALVAVPGSAFSSDTVTPEVTIARSAPEQGLPITPTE